MTDDYSRRLFLWLPATFLIVTDEQKSVCGKTLRDLREQAGKSKQELADICDLDVEMIKKLERGESEPCLMTLIKIAGGLGMKPGNLVDTIYNGMDDEGVLDRFRD